ncbi:MAG TPA: hypothetical protein VK983_00390 [Candidatus Limnocylindrales bacterium]|nr:hypothetical protein [Candidatus Limnocylindrales bacterium]
MFVNRAEYYRLVDSEAHYRQTIEEAGPYIELAKELQKRIAARLSAVTESDLNDAFSSALRDTEDKIVARGIAEKIDALPTGQILGMYAAQLGDERVKEPLMRIAAIRHQEAIHAAYLEELKAASVQSSILDLNMVQVGHVVDVTLFDTPEREEIGSRYDHRAGRWVSARKHSTSNEFEIIYDRETEDFEYCSETLGDVELVPGEIGLLGTFVRQQDSSTGQINDKILPRIGISSQLGFDGIGRPASIKDYYVGFAAVCGEIVLDASEKKPKES